MDELEKLLNEYRAKYPDAEDPLCCLVSFGSQGLLELLREANGRRIIFRTTENCDELLYSFE